MESLFVPELSLPRCDSSSSNSSLALSSSHLDKSQFGFLRSIDSQRRDTDSGSVLMSIFGPLLSSSELVPMGLLST